mmetsp:Transcript_13532/g.15509  ORF Transcript_13532/g.15509 Transcript_13532/m.15509 type:complete len:585 (+) Transcript_13532:148-1902(+)
MTESVFNKEATKAAKKAIKKADGSIKMKKLTKKIVKKLSSNHPGVDPTIISKWISSEKNTFIVNGKSVSLSRSKQELDDGIALNKVAKITTTALVSSDKIEEWRREHKIVLKDTLDDEEGQRKSKKLSHTKEYYPYATFDSERCKKHIPKSLLKQCTDDNGFEKPSPIQAQCWPVLLESENGKKRDIVGIAETGSGKTLAFAMPALSIMYQEDQIKKKKRRTPRMLVVAPTRELAMQSHDVLHEFGSVVSLRSLVVYGGVPKWEQVAELKRGNTDMVVATPGRLKDLIDSGLIDLSQVGYLVLDEADRMLDDGFREEIIYIISKCKSKEDGRRTAMFSATWPAAIQKIALEFMSNPIRTYVGFEAIVGSNGENAIDDSLSANKRVAQTVEVIDDRAREERLKQLLKKYQGDHCQNRILVFALYKKEAERLEFSLRRNGWNCCSIHGNKNQVGRTKALAEFKNGSCPLMIATDVAARGLDIPNVEAVINYTFPLTIEDYVHRIGRTGRAGKTGISYTFFQPGDKSHAGALQQVMRQAGQSVPEELLKFGSTIKKKEHKLYGAFGPTGGSGPMKKATKITFNYDDN